MNYANNNISYLPLYYEAVKGYTPIISGVAILPETSFVARELNNPLAKVKFTNTTIAVSVIVGITCAKTGRYRWSIWIGWVLTTLGAGLLILLEPSTSIPAWVFLNVPVAIGTGMLFPAMGLAVQAASRPQDSGHSAAFYSFTRVFGQSLGVAIGGVVFQNQIKQKLLAYQLLAPMATAYSKDATALVGLIRTMNDGTEKTQLIQAYADALKYIWIVMCALSAVGLLASLFTKGYSLQQEHKTLQGFDHGKPLHDPEAADSGTDFCGGLDE
jgi:MFS family permease